MAGRFRRWLAVGGVAALFGAMLIAGGVTVSADGAAPASSALGTLLEQAHDPGDAVVERADDPATIVPPVLTVIDQDD